MKAQGILVCVSLLLGGLMVPSQVSAQSKKLITVLNLTKATQKTPDFKPSGVKNKKWKPKDWLEIETVFKATKGAKKGDKYIESLTFKYYVEFAGAKGKSVVLTKELTHTNIPVGEAIASVVYASPRSLAKIANSKVSGPDKRVKKYAVVIEYEGKVVGMKDTGGSKNPDSGWWTKAPASQSDVLLSKASTPFAPLWGDYHADTQD